MKHAIMMDKQEAASMVALATIGRFVLFDRDLARYVFHPNAEPGMRACGMVLCGVDTIEELSELSKDELSTRMQHNVQHITTMLNTFMKAWLDTEFPGERG